MYLYSNIIGTFIFNQNYQIREKYLFSDTEAKENLPILQQGGILKSEKKFLERFKDIKNLRETDDMAVLEKVYAALTAYIDEFYWKNLYLTKSSVKESVTDDLLILQSSSSLQEIGKEINMTAKRLREWYSYVLPEAVHELTDHKVFAQVILKDAPSKLKSEFGVKVSMGKELAKEDMNAILSMAKLVLDLISQKDYLENYLEKLMKKICPNMTAVAGYLTGAKLLTLAGSLREMVMMPASTIQLLGAEKALFRHMINKKARSPKHGIIIEHPLVQKVSKADKGRASRALADKISMAAKIDYFKGEFIGDKLRKQLEEKFK
ncbi:MAG: NOP5/NOP56 family protein [archaeon]